MHLGIAAATSRLTKKSHMILMIARMIRRKKKSQIKAQNNVANFMEKSHKSHESLSLMWLY
jgi:hypothetical protein